MHLSYAAEDPELVTECEQVDVIVLLMASDRTQGSTVCNRSEPGTFKLWVGLATLKQNLLKMLSGDVP